MLKRGDVARIDYLWPHEERKKRGKDTQGSKDRACTVIDEIKIGDKVAAIRVVPHHGLLRGQTPDAADMPYAVKLTTNVQRAAGLLLTDREGRPRPGQKESWILAHRSNVLHVPQNPAILRTKDAKGNPAWSSGTMPPAVLKEIARKREMAIRDGVLPDEQKFFIGKGGVEEHYRKEQAEKSRSQDEAMANKPTPHYSSDSKRGQMEARAVMTARQNLRDAKASKAAFREKDRIKT